MRFLFWWVMKKKLCWLSVFVSPHLCGWIKRRPWAWQSTLLLLSYTQLVLLYLSPAPVWSQLVDIWPHGMTYTFCRSSVIWSVLTPIFPRQDRTLWLRIAWTHGYWDYRHESPHLVLLHFLLWTRKRLSQTFTRFDPSWSQSHVCSPFYPRPLRLNTVPSLFVGEFLLHIYLWCYIYW